MTAEPDPVVPPTPPEPAPPATPPAATPPAAPEPVPPDAPPPANYGKARSEAEYFARNPHQFEATMAELERIGGVAVEDRVGVLERELHIRDAIDEHGLSKEDMPFIQGGTKEEIDAAAAALKARYDAVAGTPPEAPPETTKIPVKKIGQPLQPTVPGAAPPPATPPPPLSETVTGGDGVPSIEAAKEELAKALEGVDYE